MLRLKRSRNPFYWVLFFGWLPVEILIFSLFLLIHRIDLVHLNMEANLSAAIAACVLGRPVVIHYRGKTRDDPKWFFNLFLPIVSHLANRVFAISYASGRGFFDRHVSANVEILFNPVDLSRLSGDRDSAFFDRWPDLFRGRTIITFLGRIDPQKRIVDLIDAAHLLQERHPEYAFAIVGGDPNIPEEVSHRTELDAYLTRIKPPPALAFLDRTEDVGSVLAGSSLLVLPAVNEGFGRVVVEAMAAGVPVIVANSGGPPELVKEGLYGRVVEPCRPDLLAKAIEETLADPDLMARVEAAQRYARATFDAEKYVATLLASYATLLEAKGRHVSPSV
jgi:glycosyltransferase involved in cell wall biosynthesis